MINAMRSPHPARKVVLVRTGSSAASDGQPPIRRYRVARLRMDGPESSSAKRYEYLKRTFD